MSKVSVRTEDLKRMLEKVKRGVSKEEIRPVFNGICIEVKEKYLTLITCDGYKLFTSCCEIIEGKEFTAISPVFYIPKNADKITTIEVDEEFIIFDFKNERHNLKLIKGEFIDYKSLFNRESNLKISFDVKYLLDALKGEKGIVDLEFSNNRSPMFINGSKLVLPIVKCEEE